MSDLNNPDWSNLLNGCRVIPVLVIDHVAHAVPLAKTLCEAGLSVLEITLRTEAALGSVMAIRDNVPEAILGVGTVLEVAQFDPSLTCGAEFFVSPGHTSKLIEEARRKNLAYLPGVQTLSEMMFLRENGMMMQKFFPAELNGGIKLLKMAYSVVPDVQFCPTGGVSPDNAETYLELANVACIGGSWIAPKSLINAGDWAEISTRAKQAARLGNARKIK